MASRVHLLSLTQSRRKSPLALFAPMLRAAGLPGVIGEGDIVAVKLHVGEPGNLAYIRPPYAEAVVDLVRELGGKPFLTDSTTLYTGRRRNGLDLVRTAERHGFAGVNVGAPFLPADGLKGDEEVTVPSPVEGNPPVHLAAAVARSDALVCLNHFKGHEVTGFGGALKNLGMGCSTKAGKFYMHNRSRPFVNEERCTGCGRCLEWCAYGAISLEGGTAVILEDTCTGCAHCLMSCPENAIRFRWDRAPAEVQRRIAEYATALTRTLKGRVFHVNFVTDVSPACDCYPFNAPPLVQDRGILAGDDPVAVDAASWRLVNEAPALPGSAAEGAEPGRDKFRFMYRNVDPGVQLAEGQRLGLGTTDYELIQEVGRG
jgi:uncharacterized Fe-S center protein